MIRRLNLSVVVASALCALLLASPTQAKDKVRISFIRPLTGGTAANDLGGRRELCVTQPSPAR